MTSNRRGKELATRRRARTGCALAILLLAVARPAWAEDAKLESKARYTSAQSHYNLNEFQEALQDFKEAYRLVPDPVFLFNVAQCERQLGNLEEAIKFYRSYLRNKPKAPNRQEVLRRIDEMQAAIDAKKSAPERPAPSPVPAAAGTESQAAALAPPRPAAPVPVTTPMPAPTPAATPAVPSEAAVVPAASGDRQTSTRSDLATQSPLPAPTAAPAFYQRWWFWTAAAVVVAGAGAGIYFAVSHGGNGAPSSTLGTQSVF